MTIIKRIEIGEVIDRAQDALRHAALDAMHAMHAGDTAASAAAVSELKAAYADLTRALARVDRTCPQGALVLRDAQDVLFALKSWA